MKTTVIGLGYIGLPTLLLMSKKGMNVKGFDIDEVKVRNLAKGITNIKESNLKKILKNLPDRKNLFSNYITESDVYVICVPTPVNKNKTANINSIFEVIKVIYKNIKKQDLIIIESTAPVGTTNKISHFLQKKRPDLKMPQENCKNSEVSIAYCPERVLPGNILHELENNDRVVGGVSEECAIKAKKFYNKFINGKCHVSSAKIAELSKLAENSFRDLNIAFANELSQIADKYNLNPWEIIKLTNKHPRVNILEPGPGVGGHCIAVDPWFLISESNIQTNLIKTARLINEKRPNQVLKKINNAINIFKKSKSKATLNISIALLGLSYKPDVDDIRESPSIEIAKKLIKNNKKRNYSLSELLIVEPNLAKLPKELDLKAVKKVALKYALSKSNIIVILVAHKQFERIKNWKFKNNQLIVDTKNVLK